MEPQRERAVGLSVASRREYTKAMRERYQRADRGERSELLNEMVMVAGYSRKHAITLLNQSGPLTPRAARKRSGRPRTYRHCLSAIEVAWEALDYCCAQRLHPQLLPLSESLARHGEIQLTREARVELSRISRATLARRLAELSSRKPKQIPAGPHPNRAARSLVPVDRYAWDEKRVGALEIDLVEHSDGRRGHHAYTLSIVDVVGSWSRRRAVMGKSQAVVFEALTDLLRQWPTNVWAIHSDNGGEFLGAHLIKYCADSNLTYHRSRPYQKNDNAHVEQKNRQYVREIVGYERIDNQCGLTWLNDIYQQLDTYANLFLPSVKLIEKTRSGAKLKKRYDTARTPLERLQDLNAIEPRRLEELTKHRQDINPLALRRTLDHLQRQDPHTYKPTTQQPKYERLLSQQPHPRYELLMS